MLSDSELDHLLAAEAPPVTPRTNKLDQALVATAQAAETASRRPSRTKRYVVSAVALVGVVGVGGAATATGLIPTLTPWTGSSGTSCEFIYAVDPVGAPIPESADIPRPVYDDPAVVAANTFLARYDFDSIDRQAAVDRLANRLSTAVAKMPIDQRPPAPDVTTDEFERHAVDALVQDQLAEHLKAAGFDPTSVVFSGYRKCDG